MRKTNSNHEHQSRSDQHSSRSIQRNTFWCQCFVAVIKMIIKGRSPTMRHVSRTHRVALDWLFDSINLDSKIQIRYIDTKHQLADTLTKGNFTRDEWNNVLHLFNVSHFRSTCWAKNSSLVRCPNTMAKKMSEQKGEERSAAKSKSTATNLSFSCSDNSLIREKFDCVQKSGDTHSPGEPRKQDERKLRIRRSVEFSSATERCIQWRVNGHSHGETCGYERGIR